MSFVPYRPSYTLEGRWQRLGAMASALSRAAFVSLSSAILPGVEQKFAASLEITDRCNAGCPHCYVYPRNWDQKKRMAGYLELSPIKHREKELGVIETLQKLKKRGVIHLTLVGGETGLAAEAIQAAGDMFPIVWLVTNGTVKLPVLPRSTTVFVSLDGLPERHNRTRDPMGFFGPNRYDGHSGMTATILRNIEGYDRGVFVHTTVTAESMRELPDFVDWLVQSVKKLRGIVVSGVTSQTKGDRLALTSVKRRELKKMIEKIAGKYSWDLFPLNSPKVNEFLFEKKNIIISPRDCLVARRVVSLDFSGQSVGKCIFRNSADCSTCVCNITGILRSFARLDGRTIRGLIETSMG